MNTITLVCFNCGESKTVEFNGQLNFAYQLADMANQIGMYGVLDFNYNRSLVFCNEECARFQMTKKGTFRLRPKKSTPE